MLGIALALAASVCWGSGDFLGGFSTRRASLWAVVIGSQAVGLAGAALVTLGTGHGWPGLQAVWPVMLGGLASVVAISCFYKALAIGTMSIVAPISATNALIPFVVGIAAGERPATAQLAGVALAAAGVILVAIEPARSGETIGAAALPGEPAVEPAGAAALFRARARDQTRPPGPRRPRTARSPARRGATSDAPSPWRSRRPSAWASSSSATTPPRATTRCGRCSAAGSRPPCSSRSCSSCCGRSVKVERSALPFIVAVGILDTGANGLFALATTEGYLSLVAVLGSLYPVVTVLLAFGVLRERIAPHQLAGAAATLAGVALIAAG